MPRLAQTSLAEQTSAEQKSSMPLRLLFVATSDGQGGIERHSVLLAQYLSAQGISVTYACRPGGFVEEHCRMKAVAAVPLVIRSSGDLRAARHLARLIRQHEIGIVHVHSRRDFVVAALAGAHLLSRQLRPRLVLHAHLIKPLGSPPRLSGFFFERFADGILAVSEAARRFLLEHHTISPKRVTTLHNGIVIETYRLTPARHQIARNEMRQAWKVAEDAPVLGMIGRLDAKGQRALLAVAPRILARFPNARIVLIGPEGAAGERHSLQQLAEEQQVDPAVVFAGPTENVPAVLAALDILVHLPTDESFGLVLVEAMAAGVPVVATAVGGCTEIVDNGVTGLLVPLGDTAALVEAVCRLLDDLQSAGPARAQMAHAAYCRAESKFSLARQGTLLEAFYAELRK